jgi:hypothetical protein
MAIRIKDDRTDEQKITHTKMVLARDTFMSGWGECENGNSYAAWALPKDAQPSEVSRATQWVRMRDEMRGIRIKPTTYRPSSSPNDHLHIYVWTPR